MTIHLQNIFLLFGTCHPPKFIIWARPRHIIFWFMAGLALFTPPPPPRKSILILLGFLYFSFLPASLAHARGHCSTAAASISTADLSGAGTLIQSWLKRVFHDPNNNRWHVIFIDGGGSQHSSSTADDSCTSWTDGGAFTTPTYGNSYDEFSCALDIDGTNTYLHCAAIVAGTDVLYYQRCTLTGTTPYISCPGNASQEVYNSADNLDDFQSVNIAVDSSHCVLIANDFEDDSIATTADEHQVYLFKEAAANCGTATWATKVGFPKVVQTDAGYNLDLPVGIESFGDADAQIFWLNTDTAGTYLLVTREFIGASDSFGTQRTMNADIEGSGSFSANSSVAWSTNTVTLGLDDTLDSLQAHYTTTKDGASTKVDTNVNTQNATYYAPVTIVRDTKSTGADDVWAFAVDTTDASDIDYSKSTDGGASWAAAVNNWVNDEIQTLTVRHLSSGFNTENCDIMVSWQTTSGYNIAAKVINTGSCSITVSGSEYIDEGITKITNGDPSVVWGIVNGDSSTLQSQILFVPDYSFSFVVDESVSEPIHLFTSITGAYPANTITRTNLRNNITGLDLYTNHVIVRHEDAGPLTATDMLVYENADNAEMLIYTGFGGLGIESGSELFVKSTETLSASGSAFFAVDDLDVNGTLNMTGLLLQAQGGATSTWDFTSGTLTSGGPLSVNGNSLTLTSNAATFTNLTIGANASLTTNDNLDLNGNIAITNGTGETINITGDTLNVAGNMNLSNLDTFTTTSSTVIFDGTTTLTSNGKAFNNVQIGSASAAGSLTTADTMDINGTLSVNNGGATTWNISDDTITAASTVNLTNLDTFTVAGSTVRFDGAALQTVTSASKTYNTLTSTNASASGVSFADPWTAANFIDETAGSKMTFNAGSTYTITGALSLVGTTGAGKISILSGTASSPFYFDVPSCKGVKYLTVIDSEVTGTAGHDIKAIDSESTDTRTDSAGATPKWYFNSGSCMKKGAIIIVD